MQEQFVDAIGAVISSYDDTELGRVMALGTLQGLCQFHLTEKQMARFTEALVQVAERKIGMHRVIEDA